MVERAFVRPDAQTVYRGRFRCPCCNDRLDLEVVVSGDTEQLEKAMVEEVDDDG